MLKKSDVCTSTCENSACDAISKEPIKLWTKGNLSLNGKVLQKLRCGHYISASPGGLSAWRTRRKYNDRIAISEAPFQSKFTSAYSIIKFLVETKQYLQSKDKGCFSNLPAALSESVGRDLYFASTARIPSA